MNKVEVLNEDKIGEIVSKVIAEISNKKIEKNHHYPSELNTKSIACRIPMNDYLEFNKEAKNNGMNMNDWLLDKLYNSDRNSGTINGKNKNVKTINYDNQFIELTINDFSDYIKNELIHEEEIKDVENEFCVKYDKSAIAELCWHIIRKQNIIEGYKTNLRSIKKEASIEDIKNQITILVCNKYDTSKARKSFLRDILPLLKELE
jgi:hypothetical protein